MAEGFISDDDVQKVRDANDIVAVIGERSPVKQRGRDFWCCCPLHNEKTPSFKIDPALQLWHCFGCGEGGDVFGFIMKVDDLTFPEAVRKLAERAHVDIAETQGQGSSSSKKARLKEVCAATSAFYHTQLMRSRAPAAAQARDYLSGRGFGADVSRRWGLGFAPGNGELVRHLSAKRYEAEEMLEANVVVRGRDGRLCDRFFNRVMFPIDDAQGECIAFGGRVIDQGEPKYLNSQETPIFHKSQVLYGLDKAKASMASNGTAVVVEGYTDVISLHEAGISNVVATLGTALTMRHIRILSRHAKNKIVYLFDGDAAGQRAADRALQFIDSSITPEVGKNRVEICAVTLPDDLDPAEFVAAKGADALQDLIAEAQPLIAHGIERRMSACDLSSPEGRVRALADALSVLAPIKDSLLAKDYAVQIASRVHMREQDVLDQLAALTPPRRIHDDERERSDKAASPQASSKAFDTSTMSRSPQQEDSDAAVSAADASGTAQDSSMDGQSRSLSSGERNRLRFERELLSLLAQHPLLALEHADTLAQTQWHDELHAQLAASMLATLADVPASSAAVVITNAEQAAPKGAGILTSGTMQDDASPEEVAAYLSEELSLGDAEDVVAAMKEQLSHACDLSQEEADLTFNSLVEMQRDLARRRRIHQPPGGNS